MKKIMLKKNRERKAFTMIEMSMVVFILALFLSGITWSGKKIISQSRIASARSLTSNSPVKDIPDLALWLETTSSRSFKKSELASTSISTWYDLNRQLSTVHNATAGNNPTYTENAINGLPALKFNGSSNYLQNTGTLITGNQLTVFVVISRISYTIYDGYLSMWTTVETDDYNNIGSFTLENNGDTVGFDRNYGNSGGGIGGSNVTTHPANGVPFIFSSVFDGTNNNSYLNGATAGFTNPTSITGSFNTQNFSVGARYSTSTIVNFWNGYIGEIIVYGRALSTSERQEVEKYLAQKWKIKLI